jgi:hypothetical protein
MKMFFNSKRMDMGKTLPSKGFIGFQCPTNDVGPINVFESWHNK